MRKADRELLRRDAARRRSDRAAGRRDERPKWLRTTEGAPFVQSEFDRLAGVVRDRLRDG